MSLEKEHVPVAQEEQPQVVLGLTLTATTCVEGHSVNALLDTGSPASIVSLNFFLQALRK